MAQNFIFHGFDPSAELLTITKDILWKVEGESPSKACNMAKITKVANGYTGMIKISSLSGVFIAESENAAPEVVANELYKKIHSELDNWKDSRFPKEMV